MKGELRIVPRLIDFAQDFIAIVLDEQSLIVGEWPRHLNARNQVFTCTGKFMHVLFEVHEITFYSWDRIANSEVRVSRMTLQRSQLDNRCF